MNIQQLREDHPSWKWKAVRDGFGYRYVGRKDGRVVSVCSIRVTSYHADVTTKWLAVVLSQIKIVAMKKH